MSLIPLILELFLTHLLLKLENTTQKERYSLQIPVYQKGKSSSYLGEYANFRMWIINCLTYVIVKTRLFGFSHFYLRIILGIKRR